MGNVLHVIFRNVIDTQVGVVRVARLLLHKGDANNVLPTAIAYRSVQRYGYCVSCTQHFIHAFKLTFTAGENVSIFGGRYYILKTSTQKSRTGREAPFLTFVPKVSVT